MRMKPNLASKDKSAIIWNEKKTLAVIIQCLLNIELCHENELKITGCIVVYALIYLLICELS